MAQPISLSCYTPHDFQVCGTGYNGHLNEKQIRRSDTQDTGTVAVETVVETAGVATDVELVAEPSVGPAASITTSSSPEALARRTVDAVAADWPSFSAPNRRTSPQGQCNPMTAPTRLPSKRWNLRSISANSVNTSWCVPGWMGSSLISATSTGPASAFDSSTMLTRKPSALVYRARSPIRRSASGKKGGEGHWERGHCLGCPLFRERYHGRRSSTRIWPTVFPSSTTGTCWPER